MDDSSNCRTHFAVDQVRPKLPLGTKSRPTHRIGIRRNQRRIWNVTTEAKDFIEEFGALPDPSKREVLAQLFRISGNLDYPEMSVDELTFAANEVFRGYDERESGE
jgi:hypothetical protein